MKTKLTALLATCLLACSMAAQAQTNLESDPAYLPIDKVLDLKTVTPQVNVNLPRFLLMDAVSELDLGPNDPFTAAGTSIKELIQDIKLIRFLVIETDEKTKPQVDKGIAALKQQLESKWLPIVSVPEDNVGIYAISDPSGEQIAGLAVLIYDDGDAVIGNIVGKVSIGKVLKVALQMKGGDGASFIPKDVLKKLAEISGKTESKKADQSKEKQ